MNRIRPAAWLIAAVVLFLLAVAGYALLVHAFPQYYWKQIDTAVYRDSGIAARNQPAMLYALGLGAAKLPFIYTPFAALLFAAASGASFAIWQVGQAVLTIGLLPVVAYLSLGLAGRPAGLARAAAAFAIAAVGLWLEPVTMTLFFGQINLVLLALVVGDLALPDRIKGKGIGIGLAAGIKLTPLIFIPYLLFTRRVRAAAVSALTFAVTVGLGFALLPHASAVYWGGKITRPGRKPFDLDNQSLNGVMMRLTHAGPDAHTYWLVAAVVVGIAGLATSILASRRGHELLGLVTCAATGLLVSPVTWSHHYVYVVLALALAAYGPRRLGYRILGAALVVSLFGWWPMPIGSQGGYDTKARLLPRGLLLLAPSRGNRAAAEFTWRGLELIVGNYYVLTLGVFIAATACALVLLPVDRFQQGHRSVVQRSSGDAHSPVPGGTPMTWGSPSRSWSSRPQRAHHPVHARLPGPRRLLGATDLGATRTMADATLVDYNVVMSKRAATPVRFDPPVADRLASFVAANPGMSLSSAANRLVDEAMRMAEHPGVIFRSGPTGRRAALAGGPDVWEVIRAVKSAHAAEPELDSDDLVNMVSDNTGIARRLLTTAVRYWAAYPGEVDAEIAAAEAAEEAAEQAWLRERQLLAG